MSLNIVDLEATLGLNANDYNQGIKKAQELAKQMSKRIAELEKKFKDTGKVTKAEAQELRTLTSQINTLNSSMLRVANASDKYNKAQATGKNVDQARNKLTQESSSLLNRLTTSQVSIANATEKSNKRTNALNGFMGSMVGKFAIANIAANTLSATIGKLSASLKEVTYNAFEFEKNMALVNTITNTSQDNLQKMGVEVAGLGEKLGKAPSQMAMGLYDVASSTDDTADRMKILEQATKASVAGFTDVSTAVDTGIGMMNAYGKTQDDLANIYDLQFKTIDRGIIKYDELKEALGNMMSSAVNAKVPMEEMLGQLAFLTKSGQNYAKASIALARTYDSVFEKGEKLKKYLNVDVADSNGNLRSTTDILGEMAKRLKDFDDISQVNILEEIGFSDRSSRAIIAVMNNVNGVKKEIKLVTDNVGSMEQAFKDASENTLTDWEKVKASIGKETYEWLINNKDTVNGLMKAFYSLISVAMSVTSALSSVWKLITLISDVTGISKVVSVLGKIINVSKTGAKRIADFANTLKDNYKKVQEVDDPYSKIIKYNKDFVDNNKDFFKKIAEQRDADLKNADTYDERFQASYEYKLKVINEFNKQMNNGLAKGTAEASRILNTFLGSMDESKIGMSFGLEQEQALVYTKLNKEERQQVLKTLKSGNAYAPNTSKSPYIKSNSSVVDSVINSTRMLNKEKNAIAFLESMNSAYDLTHSTSSKYSGMDTKIPSKEHWEKPEKEKKEKKDKEAYNFSEEEEKFLKTLTDQGVVKNSLEWNKQYSDFLKNAIEKMNDEKQNTDSVSEKYKSVLATYESQDKMEEFVKKRDEIFKNESDFLAQESAKGTDTNTSKYLDDYAKVLEKEIEDLSTLTAPDDKTKTELETSIKNVKKTFSDTVDKILELDEVDFLKESDLKGINRNSNDFLEEYKKFLEDEIKKAESYGKSTLELKGKLENTLNQIKQNDINEILSEYFDEIDFSNFQKEIDNSIRKLKLQGINLGTEEFKEAFDEIIFSMLKNTIDIDIPEDELSTLQEKIKNYYKQLTGFDYVIPKSTKNLEKLSSSMSDVASLTSELANLFENDLLDAMSSVLSSVASGVASYASGNMLGVATSVISIASTVKDVLSASDGIAEKQAEAYEQFQSAVEDFQSAIDDLSLGEAITYAKLEELDLSSASASTTGGSAGATINDTITSVLLGGGSLGSAISSLFNKPSNATIDTSSIKELLTSAGYTDLADQVDSLVSNYAQYSSYRNWYGKKESYVSGYDVEGFLEELQTLLDEAWRKNLDNLKEAVGLSSDDFTSNLIDVFKNGGEISDSVNDMFYNAVVQAFYNQEAFQTLNSLLGDTLSEYMLSQLGDLGIDMTLSGTLEEQLQQYYDIYGKSADILSDILKKLGISAGSASESLSSLSSQNLPSGLKTALAQYQATNTSYSEKTTSFNTIYQIENNYSKDFSDMVNNVVNKTRYVSTNNVRGSY